jgi:hypothetical protein
MKKPKKKPYFATKGKGQASRPYAHLNDALKAWKFNRQSSLCDEVFQFLFLKKDLKKHQSKKPKSHFLPILLKSKSKICTLVTIDLGKKITFQYDFVLWSSLKLFYTII